MADAIAELAVRTGNEDLDFLHGTQIDHLQKGWCRAVREADGTLGFVLTRAGMSHARDLLGW